MSKPWPGPDEILGDLEHLRRLADDLVARENQARTALRQREDAAQRRLEAARTAVRDQLAAAREAVESERRKALAQIEDRARRRTLRIRQAQRAVRKAGLDRIDAEEGRRKFELQREMLGAARERDAGRAAADTAQAEFGARMDAALGRLSGLEIESVRLLGLYGRQFRRRLAQAHEDSLDGSVEDSGEDPATLEPLVETGLEDLRSEVDLLRRGWIHRFARAWPIGLILALTPILFLPVAGHFRTFGVRSNHLLALAGAVAAIGGLLYLAGRAQSRKPRQRVLSTAGRLRRLVAAARGRADHLHRTTCARLEAEHAKVARRYEASWNELNAAVTGKRAALPVRVEARTAHAQARHEAIQRDREARLADQHAARVAAREQEAEARLAELAGETARALDGFRAEHAALVAELAEVWSREAAPILERLRALAAGAREEAEKARAIQPGPEWNPPGRLHPGARLGTVEVDLGGVLPVLPTESSLAIDRAERWSLPLVLPFPVRGSLLVEGGGHAREPAIGLLNLAILTLLARTPPGRLAFTIYDPVGLGQSFAGLTHLADEAAHLITRRIWTQSGPLEERLAELNDHLEKVIQMYLRNEYDSLIDYNEQAGNIAEKYHFLVLADFPAGFTDLALRRLQSIAASGARCGVFLLVHRDPGLPWPTDFPPDLLRQAGPRLGLGGSAVLVDGRTVPGTVLRLTPVPDSATLTAFLRKVARANRDSHRIEVPFAQVAPAEADLWTADTRDEVRVAIGRTGAIKLQYLALGKATRQHALVAGKTGSGKSTLFHVLITNLALWHAPDQVEFYLVDFKKGVEFKCYATHRLPHARVVAIESDRDFGLAVLQRLDEELRRRGEIFRGARVQDISTYRQLPGAESMPRVLLLVDEFQEFFVEEDHIAQKASALLDRIVRQGRAFGVHVVLGSQTLGGAYTVARSTLGQMVVRIALQCNEADAFLIMDEDNSAPRLLSRPGEGIYNDAAGRREGNSPFQVVWLPDDVRDVRLRQIRALAEARTPRAVPSPLVFEGDAPAEIRENALLAACLSAHRIEPTKTPRVWLGAPNSIKGPTEATLARRSGDNLLFVGQREDAMLALVGIALMALAAQHPGGEARFAVLDASPPDSPERAFLRRIAGAVPHPIELSGPADAEAVLARFGTELRARTGSESGSAAPAWFLVILGLPGFRALRPEDEFSFSSDGGGDRAASILKELVAEGPTLGMHTLATCDTYGNVQRFLGRKTLAEFGLRVLFQMSANDSASLIDHPAAGRLGFHRALLYQDREGRQEIFRPYALPDSAWIEEATRALARLVPKP